MRKFFSLVLLFTLIALPVYAADAGTGKGKTAATKVQPTQTYGEACAAKIRHGAVNLISGWMEVPAQMAKGYNDGFGATTPGKDKLLGGFLGLFRGLIHAVGRTASGGVQLVTSPLPNPKSNAGIGIPLDSEWVWEDTYKQYSIINQGWDPVGEKLLRGIYNSLLGLVDAPGQFIKGVKLGHPFVGTIKTIGYPLSRMVYGVSDIVTFLLPNDPVTHGFPLSEKYPWDSLKEATWDNDL